MVRKILTSLPPKVLFLGIKLHRGAMVSQLGEVGPLKLLKEPSAQSVRWGAGSGDPVIPG